MTSKRDPSARACLAAAIAGVWVCAFLSAQQSSTPPQSTFRGGVDLIRLDVTVLDKDRKPVRGLTAADFTVVEDGKPRPIETFAAVELPPPPPQPMAAPWMRNVAPDVTTNAHGGGHALVIMIDDAAVGDGSPMWGVLKTRIVARAAVDELGPEDVGSVVFTAYNHTAQDFTADRARLLAAIDSVPLFPVSTTGLGGYSQTACYCGECTPEVLRKIGESLRGLAQQRKTVLYIGPGGYSLFETRVPTGPCGSRVLDQTIRAIREAQLNNITVHAVDPNGLCGALEGCRANQEALRTLSESTGGRAVVYNNDPEREIPSIFDESRSYYLLGFVPAPSTKPGVFHSFKVRVNREDVEVRARAGYYTPTDKERRAMDVRAASVEGTIATPLPTSGVPLGVTAAPFLDVYGKPQTAIVLNVSQPLEMAQGRTKTERVEVIASAFGQETGKFFGTQRQVLSIVWNPGDAFAAQYEVRSRLPLPPGRYAIRVGVKSPDRNGSVYTYVDVPKFDKDDLSVSGLAVTSTPAPKAAPATAFANIIPVVPTARRDFDPRDRVSAFLRIHQGGAKVPAPVDVTMRVVDTLNQNVVETTQRLEADAFRRGKSADYRVPVPVDKLRPGEYLMIVDMSSGERNVQRTMRFRVN